MGMWCVVARVGEGGDRQGKRAWHWNCSCRCVLCCVVARVWDVWGVDGYVYACNRRMEPRPVVVQSDWTQILFPALCAFSDALRRGVSFSTLFLHCAPRRKSRFCCAWQATAVSAVRTACPRRDLAAMIAALALRLRKRRRSCHAWATACCVWCVRYPPRRVCWSSHRSR
jgi:hypothetical protein